LKISPGESLAYLECEPATTFRGIEASTYLHKRLDIASSAGVMGQVYVEAGLRRQLAIPPCGIAATASN
jgi:hypothetical protein